MNGFKYIIALCLISLQFSAQAERVKDVSMVEGVRSNQLVGMVWLSVCLAQVNKADLLNKALKPC